MREFSVKKSLRSGIWIAAVATIVLALSGPFGTYDTFGLGNRFLFWSAAMIVGAVIIQASVIMVIQFGPTTKRGLYGAAIVGTLFGSVPATALIMIIFERSSGIDLPTSYFPILWSNVALVGCVISCVHIFAQIGGFQSEKREATEPEEVPVAAIEHVPILTRLPDGLRPCQIMSFSMQDHYVEVTTMDGKSLLLMRLTDAINELGDLRGARVHRSHWVSLRHLVDIKKDGRKTVAVLTDDRKIPISNPYLDDARALLKEKNAAQ